MPTISNTQSTVPEPQIRRFVETKSEWSGQWVLVPYADPVACRQMSGPSVGDADFAYSFGRIKREDSSAYVDYNDLALNDNYVRVSIQRPGEKPTPIWHGIVADTESTLISSARKGDQSFKAFELSHLLDRVEIRTSWAKPTKPSGDVDVVEINRPIVFNERLEADTILGNRSAERNDSDDADEPSTFFFTFENGVPWSAWDVVEYLLKRHAPPEIVWEMVGQTEPLTKTFAIWDFAGKTVWQALNELIRRDRGLGFYLRISGGQDGGGIGVEIGPDNTPTVELVVYSIAERAYSYGIYELPANDNQVFLALPGDQTAHLVSEIPFRNTATTQYDVIEVVGKRFLACATFSVLDGTLEKAWTDELETLYNQGIGVGDDEELNEQYRAKEGFAAVYSHFKVPVDWDLKCAGAELTLGTEYFPVVPLPLENGDYDAEETGQFWNYGRTFESETPFYPDFNYDEDTKDEIDAMLTALPYTPKLRPLLVGIRWTGFENDEDAKYIAIDRLRDVDEELSNPGSISVLDGALGVDIQFSPRHYLGRDHFIPEDAAATFVDPVLNWEELFVTAMFETDDPPKITLRRLAGTPAEVEKKLRIDVPGAEYWFVSKMTVVDCDENGDLVHYLNGEAEPQQQYLRYDRDKLEAVASFASAWYGPRRQAVNIPIKELGVYVPIGSLLADIRGVFGTEPIRTPVTSILWDLQRDRTIIETGYAELDYVGLMDENPVSEQVAAELEMAERARIQSVRGKQRTQRTMRGPTQGSVDAYNAKLKGQW